MTFLGTLGDWAKKTATNFGNEIGLPTALHDIASVATNDKSWVGDAFQIAGDTFKGVAAGATYVPRKALAATFNDVVMPVARTSYNLGGKYVREPLSAGLLGAATGDFGQAWENRNKVSAGQALAYLQSRFDPTRSALRGDFNIFDPNDRKIFDTNWEYRTLSGAYDSIFSTVTDPLSKVGKAAGLARKAIVLRPMGAEDATAASLAKDFLFTPGAVRKATIISPQTLATRINDARTVIGPLGEEQTSLQKGLNGTLEWFAQANKVTIRNHPMVAASNDADTLAYLLGEAKTVDDVADTLLATATKDTEAMARLVAKRKDLSFVMDKIKPVSEVDKNILNNVPTNGIVEDVNVLDAAAAHVEQAMQDPYIDYLTKLNEKGADLTKRTFGTSAFEKMAQQQAERKTARALGIKADETTAYPTFGIFQPTKYHPLVAVINFAERWAGERPAGYFNANDSDSFNEMKAFAGMLRNQVGNKSDDIITQHYDAFIQAGDNPEGRAKVAQSFEDFAVAAINKELGISDETAKVIWDGYKGRRATAMASIRDRKFLMTNDDTILKIPYLERQGANALPMVDLENYARVLKENSGLVKAIQGSHGIVDPDRDRYIAGLMNDVWKASVLLRLGYTVRNISEASLSILAKGYGLVAATDLSTEGFKNWWEHRTIGLERMTDKTLVAKGLREDSVKLRQELSNVQRDRAQINRLNAEIDDHMAAVELAFKRGKLTEEQALEFLNISSYRTGEYMYHGSPVGLSELDTTRPLAMTFSSDIAQRYADASMKTISASEIYRRISGRAYPMPKNLRSAETGALIKEGGLRQPSAAMQTVAMDMRDGFRNSVNNGNQVELLNPQTGSWRSIDPDTVSQKMLVEGTFRIRKPGNQGQVVASKVFGRNIDLRTYAGSQTRLGLDDYPELKAIIGLKGNKPTSWKGKEPQLLEWMRANGVGKLVLPDVKGNGRASILVDPNMVETATNKPAAILAKRRLDGVRKQQTMMSDDNRLLNMIRTTIENEGGTFGFTGDIPKSGFSVAVRGATFQHPLAGAIANPEAMREQLIAHIENTFDKFEGSDHFGTWVAPNKEGVPTIWCEPVNVVKSRAKAAKLGEVRNQEAVADLERIANNDFDNAFINTHGTGDESASEQFALGQVRKASAGDVTAGTQGVRGATRGPNTASISELANQIGNGKYPADGIISLVRDLADRSAMAKARHENLLQRLDARVVEENRLTTSKKLVGTGMRRAKLYDGTIIEHPDAFHGELGQILMQRTDNAETYKLMADAPSQLFAARYGNMEETRLSHSDPRYYNGYANFVNNFFRSPTENKIDPVIEQFLNGRTPEQVIKWLRKPENKAYASKMNIDDLGYKVPSERLNVGTSAEDFVGNLHSAYQRYLPDAEIQEAFRNNNIDEMFLRNHFADTPAMPDIVGSTVPIAQKVGGIGGGMQEFVNKAFHYLGSLPETTLARHPLARAVYRSEMQNRANIALSLKRSKLGNENAELTVDEINGLRRDAVESTRKEVNKTLFTIVRKSYAGEKMRYLMPFFNAWENTIRRWSTLSMENPTAVARAGQITSSLSNQNNYVDQNGNPAKGTNFSYNNSIVLPMPETFIKTMESVPGGKGLAAAIRSAGSQLTIPIKSMDVMFQGEATAGFGPIAAIPAAYLEQMRPDLEPVLQQVIPYGAPESPIKGLLPPALQKATELWQGTRDGQWSRTFNTVYRYELIKWRLGDRQTEPTFEEIQGLTNNMYKVKALSNLVLPFAAQYDSPLSWYTQQYHRLQQAYGAQADALFLQMYPEMGEATISASLNTTGVQASQTAFKNTEKYKSLISKIGATNPEMIGFIVNDPSGKYDFSQAVYQWQGKNAPVPGSTDNFRQTRNPALLKIDADKKMGWIDYRKAMDYLDSQLFGQGFTSYSQNGAEELNLAKQMFTQQLASTNKNWAADFYSMDKGKWIYRMQSIQTMLTDPKWIQDNGNKPVVGAIATYYTTRMQIQRELASRKAGGGSGALTSKDNEDLDGMWNQTIATLKQESGEFSSFYNRFLQNDPVTLG